MVKASKADSWRNNPKLSGCLSEIERFGGQSQVDATVRALSDMKSAIARNVASTPDAFDATHRAESQEQATDRIMEHVSEQYVKQLVAELRQKSGYIQVCGVWTHRSLITFLAYGILAAVALTIFIPMILSPKPGRLCWGAGGLLVTVGIGVVIFLRTRN